MVDIQQWNRLLPYEPAHPLRSGQEALLKVPSLKEVRGWHAETGPSRLLPPNFGTLSLIEICLALTLLDFWCQAETFLFILIK